MIFVTGAANVGKTSLINRLKHELPADKFDIHDIDETGKWSGEYSVWRDERIDYWLKQSVINRQNEIETILCGIIFPQDVERQASYRSVGIISYILLDASSDDIQDRFRQKRKRRVVQSFQDNGALHIATQAEIAKRLHKIIQKKSGYIINTSGMDIDHVTQQVLGVIHSRTP